MQYEANRRRATQAFALGMLLLQACGISGLTIDDDAGTEDARPDARVAPSQDLPSPPSDLPPVPDLPTAPDLLPASPDLPPALPDVATQPVDLLPVDTRPRPDSSTPADSPSDPARSYERPDVFTHEVRALDASSPIDASPSDASPSGSDVLPHLDVLRADAIPVPTDLGAPDAGPRIVTYPLPTKDCSPQAIAAGSDGNLWFTEACGRVGRITTEGVIAEFPVFTANAFPASIVAGPDGNMWFVEAYGDRIGRVTPAGVITEFLVPTVDSGLADLAFGPDGNLWFTEMMGNKIGRMTLTGEFTEFVVPPENLWPSQMTLGSDGHLWFTTNGIALGRISTTGAMTPVLLPFDLGATAVPTDIVTGPDGNLWLGLWRSDTRVVSVLRVTVDGAATEYPLAGEDNGMQQLVVGPDGNLWLTLTDNRVGRFTLQGEFTAVSISQQFTYPQGIAAGPDGNIWFTTTSGNGIGRIRP